MDWTQLFASNTFLILSILSGAGAAAVLVHAVLRSKLTSNSSSDAAGPSAMNGGARNKNWRQTALDKITVLNKNLIQCPRCFRIDFSNVRFCSGCGLRVMSPIRLLRSSPGNVETYYAVQDGSTRVVGISMRPDARTKIGVIIGLQDEESLTEISSAQQD